MKTTEPSDEARTTEQIVAPPSLTVPPLVIYADEAGYRGHFERGYCVEAILTFDGISVRFRKQDFDHCCFKSTKKDDVKDSFCERRASRIDWIRHSLQLATAELHVGWNKKKRMYDFTRRVSIIENSFVTVIVVTGDKTAKFWTSYHCADKTTIRKIRSGPKWGAKRSR